MISKQKRFHRRHGRYSCLKVEGTLRITETVEFHQWKRIDEQIANFLMLVIITGKKT